MAYERGRGGGGEGANGGTRGNEFYLLMWLSLLGRGRRLDETAMDEGTDGDATIDTVNGRRVVASTAPL